MLAVDQTIIIILFWIFDQSAMISAHGRENDLEILLI